MHFIFIQLLLVLTASAVPLIDVGQLYDQKLPIPDNDIHNSNGGVDIGELNEYRKSDPINYPTRSKRGVEDFSDVNKLGSKEKGLDIDKLPQYNSIDSTNYPPRSKRSDEQLSDVSEREYKDYNSNIGQLSDQNSQTITDDVDILPQSKLFIGELLKYNSINTTNYPRRSKRSKKQLSDVSELESKDGANDIDQLDDQNLQTTTDDVSNLYNDGLDIEIFDQDNSSDTTNYPPRSKRSNEQLSNVSKLESKDGSNDSDQNSQTTSDVVSNLYDDGFEFYAFILFSSTDTTDYPPRSKRSNEQLSDVYGLGINNSGIDNDAAAFSIQPLTKDDIPVIEIGSLYNHEGKIPRNELPGSPNNPGPVDLEDLHQYKGNYPVYPRH
ncbi:uncharacterized protein LOC130666568 [Microplitis mediator]|uniref:uncharacterized protein LOC130666568 n=1 Tax=Microplitis mediator TaxID=375433 RepID=UPI002554877A|nr:uncharacterized protein LOC130666568 [Microplitis mediator]